MLNNISASAESMMGKRLRFRLPAFAAVLVINEGPNPARPRSYQRLFRSLICDRGVRKHGIGDIQQRPKPINMP